MAASNTRECFKDLIGHSVIGVLFDALPPNRKDLAAGTKTLVLDDGTGLTIASNGSFWRETAGDVDRAIAIERKRLAEVQSTYEAVLALAGVKNIDGDVQ